MPELAHYYLARVVKSGLVTPASVIEAIREPVVVVRRRYSYTFTGISSDDASSYIFGYLTKFIPAGEVDVVDPSKHSTGPETVDNLQHAASPFIYIPSEAVVAYQHVWNHLQREMFEEVFSSLVEEKHQRFFAECRLKPISDLRTFVQRIASMDKVLRIEATVNPPNPLFGPLWDSLRKYMRERNVGQVSVTENAASTQGITTHVPQVALGALQIPTAHRENLSAQVPGLADAAVLMAADGYGKARVDGERNGAKVVVRTRETQLHFLFARRPDPAELYELVSSIIRQLNKDRGLRHDD